MANSPWGGSEHLWHQTAAALLRADHEVFVNVCRWSSLPTQIDELSTLGANVKLRYQAKEENVPRVFRKFGELYSRARGPTAMRNWVRRVRPDLICISNGCFDDNIHLSLACADSGIPYVVIAHANGECMWPTDDAGHPVAKLYRGARLAFFVADRNRRMLEDQLGIPLPNAELVRNPCAITRDSALAWPDESNGLRLACVGRIDPRSKGQDILLHALARSKWRDRQVSVSIFGDGPNKQSLHRLAERLGLLDSVRFAGFVHDVAEIWRSHHALVLPSRYEGLPISIVEAMLCARPAIVTDVGGNAEIVEDGSSGFVADWPTEESFDRALERAWQSRKDLSAMGHNAHVRALDLIPHDPGSTFAARLLDVAQGKHAAMSTPEPRLAAHSTGSWSVR